MDKRVIFAVAGSGKTTYIVDSLSRDNRSLIVTYTVGNYNNLCRKISEKFNGDWPENIWVMGYFTFLYRFCYKPFLADMLKTRGIFYEKNPNNRLRQCDKAYYITSAGYIYSNRLALLIEHTGSMEALKRRLEKYFDEFIVDEIQDFTMAEIQEFINATRKHFLFFGDPAQSVYGKYKSTMPVQNICQVFGANEKIKKIPLYNNYRLPLPVARLVQYIGVNLPPFYEDTYKSPEKEMPYVLRYDSLETQVRAIYRLIRMDLTDVAILLPENDLVKQVVSIFTKLNYSVEFKYKEGKKTHDTLNFSTTAPKVMTYHSAKGLQFENVFIPVLEYFQDDGADRRTALYVAMTRTYKRLYVMYSGRLLPEFWQRLNIPSILYKESEYEEVLDF